MHVGFRITLEDGSTISSHDEMWNETKVHAHALAPHSLKKWIKYEIVTDEGFNASVDFITGVFTINGIAIHPAEQTSETIMTSLKDPQNFSTTEPWEILNGLPYFPVVGRRFYKGDMFEAQLFYCGWKRKFGKKTVQKILMFNPANRAVVLT